MPLGPVSASLLFYHAHSILQEISSFYCFAKSRQSKVDTQSLLSWFIGHGEINQSRILLFLKRPSQGAFFFQIIVGRNKKTDPTQKRMLLSVKSHSKGNINSVLTQRVLFFTFYVECHMT